MSGHTKNTCSDLHYVRTCENGSTDVLNNFLLRVKGVSVFLFFNELVFYCDCVLLYNCVSGF